MRSTGLACFILLWTTVLFIPVASGQVELADDIGIEALPPSALEDIAQPDIDLAPVEEAGIEGDSPVDAVVESVDQSEEPVVDDEDSPDALRSEDEDVVYLVRLQQDGNFSGRIRIVYPTGKTTPADAKIDMHLDDQLVESAQTDEQGEFTIAGLEPGNYLATATIETGSTDFPVHVLPFDENATEAEMILDATLTPTPEVILDSELIVDGEFIDPCMEGICDMGYVVGPCTDGGFSGGGCCGGGGGGFGGGLGLLGLAGLAGLAGDSNNNNRGGGGGNGGGGGCNNCGCTVCCCPMKPTASPMMPCCD